MNSSWVHTFVLAETFGVPQGWMKAWTISGECFVRWWPQTNVSRGQQVSHCPHLLVQRKRNKSSCCCCVLIFGFHGILSPQRDRWVGWLIVSPLPAAPHQIWSCSTTCCCWIVWCQAGNRNERSSNVVGRSKGQLQFLFSHHHRLLGQLFQLGLQLHFILEV